MGEQDSNVAELSRQVGDLRVQVGKLEAIQESNHRQNRNDIHDIRDALQSLIDKVTNIRLENARWNIAAGVVTAVLLKAIDAFWHSGVGR